ncbi:MAG: DNRLRE domain-containing protein [Armatimonadota bacterium]
MRGVSLCLVLALCSLLSAIGTQAQEQDYTLVLKQGVNGYYGTTDTYMYRDYPTTNYGTSYYIRVYRTADRVDQNGLIKFDLSGQIPQGAVITSAILSLNVCELVNFDTNDWADVGVYRVGQYRDWVETQATWNVFKGSSYWSQGGAEYVPSDHAANPDSVIRFYKTSPTGYYHWTVTSSVQAWYGGSAANNGWLVRIAGNDGSGGEGVTFYSKEYSSSWRPYLTINYTLIPEPSSILALSAGLFGLLALRRKR